MLDALPIRCSGAHDRDATRERCSGRGGCSEKSPDFTGDQIRRGVGIRRVKADYAVSDRGALRGTIAEELMGQVYRAGSAIRSIQLNRLTLHPKQLLQEESAPRVTSPSLRQVCAGSPYGPALGAGRPDQGLEQARSEFSSQWTTFDDEHLRRYMGEEPALKHTAHGTLRVVLGADLLHRTPERQHVGLRCLAHPGQGVP
jgi:hypothetical protein